MLGNLIYFVPAVISFFFAYRHFIEQDIVFWVSIAVFLCSWLFGVCFDVFRFKRYRCKECGALLKRTVKEDRRIIYICHKCNIAWDTTLQIPTD
jgi:hypothetical protein